MDDELPLIAAYWVLAISDVVEPAFRADAFYRLRASPVLGIEDGTIRSERMKRLWFTLFAEPIFLDGVYDPPEPSRLRIIFTFGNGQELIVLPPSTEL